MAEIMYLDSLGRRDRRLTKLLERGTGPAVAALFEAVRLEAFRFPFADDWPGTNRRLGGTALRVPGLLEEPEFCRLESGVV